jgi:hypothetical protein
MHDVGRKVIVGENVARRKATQIDHGENDHHAPQPNVFLNFAVPRKTPIQRTALRSSFDYL